MATRILFIITILALLVGSAISQEKYVKPVDEAAKDASFLAFRTKLIAAAERRDVNYLLSIIDPKIKNGFGGEDGISNFKRVWKITSKKSGFWKEFLPVVKNGGAFDKSDKTSFMAPYTFSSWPDDVDGFDYEVIFGNNVNLRKEPNMNAEVVSKLSYNVVEVEYETLGKSDKSVDPEWLPVTTKGGLKGFVKSEFVRSHIDFRAGFTKKRGVWKMDFFVAGD
ncbi:MAG: SH3 domain-containing protein [Acidobacteria bacterium]|nr:SH3 domain-containing protein [Acidobacteriota bacterium]MBK9527689.1 SH3 domain-containing protein [Acidobacteriota bacterium]MBP7474335.1 SH3 domain-containing protein [Pyrinomonadaceae bacterium]MBP9109596.1 SH3 domain-containing protein [Pyrinomonadaceae bacterium]